MLAEEVFVGRSRLSKIPSGARPRLKSSIENANRSILRDLCGVADRFSNTLVSLGDISSFSGRERWEVVWRSCCHARSPKHPRQGPSRAGDTTMQEWSLAPSKTTAVGAGIDSDTSFGCSRNTQGVGGAQNSKSS